MSATEAAKRAEAQKQYRADAEQLRAEGVPANGAAQWLRERHKIGILAALRYAHGWTQSEAAGEWTRRWPRSTTTYKEIAAWEARRRWPGAANIERLAELYGYDENALLVDLAAERRAAETGRRRTASSPVRRDPHYRGVGSTVDVLLTPMAPLLRESQELDLATLTNLIVKSVQRTHPDVGRRDVLLKLGTAVALAAAAPALGVSPAIGADHTGRLAGGASDFQGVIDHARTITLALRHQDVVLGPRAPLQTALTQRSLLAERLGEIGAGQRADALSAYAELCQLSGWLTFNLGDVGTSMSYYEEARAAAHEALDVELVTYVLCAMAHAQTWAGRPRVGIDHAVAAANWATKTGSAYAEAYAANVSVRAYAAAGDQREAFAAVDRERAAFERRVADATVRPWWCFYGESFPAGTEAEAALALDDLDRASAAITTSLANVDQGNLAHYTVVLLRRAELVAKGGDIPEACTVVGDVADLAATNTSQRLRERINRLTNYMAARSDSQEVQALNERLTESHYLPAAT